jgi:hypothetical protein
VAANISIAMPEMARLASCLRRSRSPAVMLSR